MDEYIAFDSHKYYTLMEREQVAGAKVHQQRIEHRPGSIRSALAGCRPGTPVAVEAIGNWYWIVDEIEEAGLQPLLVHPRKAKLMMGMINKTDKLDVHGLNRLQRNGTLPVVWIPPAGLRDLRELTRTRIFMGRQRTRLKNRIQAGLAKYGLQIRGYSDVFAPGARATLQQRLGALPEQTRYVGRMLLEELDRVQGRISALEGRLDDLIELTPQMKLLMSLPGVAAILGATIALEIGDVSRFPSGEHLASYAGTTPRVHASGGKVRYGRLRCDVNRTLKWAYAEAGNSVAVNHMRRPGRHVSRLYWRIRRHKGHAKAIGAVARHLAEASFHVLNRKEPYRDPALKQHRTRKGPRQAGASATVS
ncbi:MAG: IS110 family transposase [Candidatus Brocadiae bacterium]|nr:IS110 family transposase [Candidatus Brocadiia bacterium]